MIGPLILAIIIAQILRGLRIIAKMRPTPPQPDPDLEYKQSIVLILCFKLIIAGFLLGWYITILWTILSLALSLILYVWAFHIHWRARR